MQGSLLGLNHFITKKRKVKGLKCYISSGQSRDKGAIDGYIRDLFGECGSQQGYCVKKKKHYISEPNCSNLIIGIEEVQLYVEPKIHSKEAGFHFHRWRIFFFCKMDGFYS